MNKSLYALMLYLKRSLNNNPRASDIKRIVDTVVQRKTVDKFSQVVERDEIRRNAFQCGIGDIMELTKDVI